MCGISGIINLDSRLLNSNNILDMDKVIKVMNHRGPDDSGLCGFSFSTKSTYHASSGGELLNKGFACSGLLGFNRLSIKDLSIAGHQPMEKDGVIIVFNGEIYNDKELKEKLVIERNCKFKGTSDTEVILNYYIEYGFEKLVTELNGMFAIAIIDLNKGLIYMARDRFGIKPLYYTFYNGKVAFASELKGIIQFSDFDKKLDIDAANARLIFSRIEEAVLLDNVSLLNPGESLIVTATGNVQSYKFFSLDNYTRDYNKYHNIEEAMEDAEDILSDAVSRQMVSDVKVGCQLSGGLDSSLVSYFANKMRTDNMNDAVSIVDQGGVIGEEKYIDHVGEKLNLNLHKFTVDTDYFVDNYEKLIWSYDAPVYKPFFVCYKRLAEKSKEHVTVLLSGEGADEIAGGYTRFGAGFLQPFLSQYELNKNGVKNYNSYAEYEVMSDTTLVDLATLGYNNLQGLIQDQVDKFNSFEGTNFTKQLKYEIAYRLTAGLLRQDKMTMSHSIENRVPLLDNNVVDFVMRLPEEMLVRFASDSPVNLSNNPFSWFQGKYILKEIVANKFGHEFAYRKKQTMNGSLNERDMLASSGFEEYYRDVVFPGIKSRGILDADLINKWYESIHQISSKQFNSMWRAIGLETWCQLFLDA